MVTKLYSLQRIAWFSCLAAGLLGPHWLHGADPQLTALDPYGAQRGTEVVVELRGERLGDSESLLLYRPGVEVVALEAIDDRRVSVTCRISPDCPLGLHGVRVRTASGISNLQLFSVGALPEVREVEPNSDFDAPQAVEFPCTVNGVIQNEDVDYFVVTARQGDRLSVEVEGVRLGMPPGNATFFDPYVAILDRERFELASCDDTALLRQDPFCSLIVPEDGEYVIELRESAYGGNDLCRYRLHIGSFPRPTAVLPAGGRPGETVEVNWIGDPRGPWASLIELPTGADSELELFAQDEWGISPSPLSVRVNELPNILEIEPNDDRASATVFTAPAALHGVIFPPGDSDHFRFSATQGETFDLRVFARQTLRSPLDSVLTVTRADGSVVGGNDDSGGPDSYLRFTAPEDGQYVLIVYDHLRSGGPDFTYRLEVSPVIPALTLSLPERIQYVPVTVSVPSGNRMAIMINAARVNFGGDLSLAAEGLPPGLTVSELNMPAALSSIPALFTADADTPSAGALAQLIGRAADTNVDVVGRLHQRTMLVRGQNNVDVWGHDADRMAVAVTRAVPFTIEIVPPQVPIVRDGSMELKVVARRDAGFREPIALSLLYTPPGIGASGSITIPAEVEEAAIPLTANSGAAIGTWPIVVLGRAQVGNGPVDVASQMVDLEIAEPFLGFTFEKAAGELGQEADVIVRIEKRRDFDGSATAQLLGLPAKTETDPAPREFTTDTEDLVFRVRIESDAKPGKYQGLVCRAVVSMRDEPIVHTLGAGELRIDEPLPPQVDAPEPPAEPEPEPAVEEPVEEPVEKRLSRLEQLRQDRLKKQGNPEP
jgi:hypothetical protein